jgi:hypothetical protein
MERLVVVDLSASVCSAWRESFADYPEVSVVHGRFDDLPNYDCIVASANSYGSALPLCSDDGTIGAGDDRRVSTAALRSHATTKLIYIVSAAVLVALPAGPTVVTGSRTQVIWFRVCPFALTAAGALLVAASLV